MLRAEIVTIFEPKVVTISARDTIMRKFANFESVATSKQILDERGFVIIRNYQVKVSVICREGEISYRRS